MVDKEKWRQVFERYLNDSYHQEDLDKLVAGFHDPEVAGYLRELLNERFAGPEPFDITADDRIRKILDVTDARVRGAVPLPDGSMNTPGKRTYRFWDYAAAVVLIGLAAYFAGNRFFPSRITSSDRTGNQASHVILPGTNRATLTLADGKEVELSSGKSGVVMEADGIHYNDGTEVLDPNEHHTLPVSKPLQAVISTPKGGQYQVVLSDGTQVWLNAQSILRYPLQFTGSKRTVEIEGEGYFIVAKQKNNPFTVISKGQEVTALGTSFNISAYADGKVVTTTLIEGAVQVSMATQSTILYPGEQSTANHLGSLSKQLVDTEEVIAWTSGMFYFNKTDVREALMQLSRWYNIEVVYETNPKVKHFYGRISRDYTLSQVLEVLQLGGLNFEIQQRNKDDYVLLIRQ